MPRALPPRSSTACCSDLATPASGINPASDDPAVIGGLLRLLDEIIGRLQIPTQGCVLTHVTTTLGLIGQGLPVDLVFQSIAGTQAANKSFGVDLALLSKRHQAGLSLRRGNVGNNVMYFETGQGSALSANAHHGVDQQTLEARAYGVARAFDPLLVNSVVGFIGPEYLYDGKEIIRAGLEDHFCGKLLGLPLGIDICYTNHAEADQDDMDNLLTLLAAAGVNFIMGVPGADDVMLNYQSTSFHDALYVRDLFGLKRRLSSTIGCFGLASPMPVFGWPARPPCCRTSRRALSPEAACPSQPQPIAFASVDAGCHNVEEFVPQYCEST